MLDRWQGKEIIEVDERRREAEKNGLVENGEQKEEEKPLKVGFKDKFAMSVSGCMVIFIPIVLILFAFVGILLLIINAL